MNFRPFAGTHVRITEQEAIPQNHISQKPYLSKTLTFTFFVVKVGTQSDGSSARRLVSLFSLESRGWLRKTANKNDNPIYIYIYIYIQLVTLFYST